MRRLLERWRRVRSLRRRNELESGLDEEIRFHIDRETEKNVRAGMTPVEAHRQALIKFGGVDRAKESTRDQFRFASIEDFLRDIRYGGRALLRAPGFTIVAILTLALGIGATTAMFSVVNGILLRPLPYPEQDRLIEVVHEAPGLGIRQLFASPAIYFAYRDHSRTFESVGLWDWDSSPATVTGSGEPESVQSLERWVRGSSGLTPNNCDAISRVSPAAAPSPIATPIPTRASACRTNIRRTSPYPAPRQPRDWPATFQHTRCLR